MLKAKVTVSLIFYTIQSFTVAVNVESQIMLSFSSQNNVSVFLYCNEMVRSGC